MYKATFTTEELIKITGGKFLGKENILGENFGISTDTRTITSDDAYLALSGAVFDGHEFVNSAFEKGATSADAKSTLSSLVCFLNLFNTAVLSLLLIKNSHFYFKMLIKFLKYYLTILEHHLF